MDPGVVVQAPVTYEVHYTALKDPDFAPDSLRAWVVDCARLGFSRRAMVAADPRAGRVLKFLLNAGYVELSAPRSPSGPMPPPGPGQRRGTGRPRAAPSRAEAEGEGESWHRRLREAEREAREQRRQWAERERANELALAEARRRWVESLAERKTYSHRPRTPVLPGSSATGR